MKLKTESLRTEAVEKYKFVQKYEYKIEKSLGRLQFGI